MIGIWTCVYCEGAWLQRLKARSLFGELQEAADNVGDASADASTHLTCPSCDSQSMRSRTLGDNKLFVCDCGSAYLPQPAVAALCIELGGQPWQLGALLRALVGPNSSKTDLAITASALLLLFLT